MKSFSDRGQGSFLRIKRPKDLKKLGQMAKEMNFVEFAQK